MPSIFWILVVLLLIGFLHGLHSDHVQEILAQYDRNVFYREMAKISLEAIIDHMRLFLPVLLGAVFLRFVLSESSEYTVLIFIAFLGFAITNFYLFFFQKVSLHQHAHDHSHKHGHNHVHGKSESPASFHADGHDHPLPQELDRPREATGSHRHDHGHSHSHLHLHQAGDTSKHKEHRHSPEILDRFFELRNFSVLFLLAAIVIVFPLTTGVIGVGTFFCGAYFSIYLLSIIYMASGIRFMEKCISFSNLFSGIIALIALSLF